MAKQIIKLTIDVSKIDKDRLYRGKKGTYLDATLFLDDQPDDYDNNGMIVENVTKNEREQGKKGTILGNAKIFAAVPTAAESKQVNDDLPF